VFGLRVLIDRLPSKINLENRGFRLPYNLCPLCNKDAKSIQHIMLSGEVAQRLWVKCDKWTTLFLVTGNNIAGQFLSFYLTGLSPQINRMWREMWLALTKVIWMYRNKVIFEGGQRDFSIGTVASLKLGKI